jgi:hypothetical protein
VLPADADPKSDPDFGADADTVSLTDTNAQPDAFPDTVCHADTDSPGADAHADPFTNADGHANPISDPKPYAHAAHGSVPVHLHDRDQRGDGCFLHQ